LQEITLLIEMLSASNLSTFSGSLDFRGKHKQCVTLRASKWRLDKELSSVSWPINMKTPNIGAKIWVPSIYISIT